jgi:Holliday junction resolvase RusA-like endonuclease
MITGTHGFMVIGLPVPQGTMICRGSNSKTGKGRHILNYQNAKELNAWRDLVEAGARRYVGEEADEGQPLEALLTWSLPRPNSHYGTGRNSDRLKDLAPLYPTSRPDVDKLTRAILDALTKSRRIVDDAQVTDAVVRKRYATTRGSVLAAGGGPDAGDVLPVPGVVVRIYPIED